VIPAEGFAPTLATVVAVFERFGIRFHLTGGIVSVIYGEPRMTQDVDIVLDRRRVVDVQESFLDALSRSGLLFSAATARRAIGAGEMFQVLDPERVVKVDLYLRSLVPGELDRSVRVELFPGTTLPIAARTDAALSKLIWIQRGSHRSRRDLRRILEAASAEEQLEVRTAAHGMGLEHLLDQVIEEPDEINP